ncbi:MAG TPA: RDD family protein [Puia sp.]|nr:RDD family protein [Puia sp.]
MFVKLDTGFNIEVDFPISPFHKRLFGWFIDLVVMIAYLWMGSKLLSAISDSWASREWRVILFGLPPLFYHLFFEIAWNGQSIGKKAMGIRVISADGGQPSISQFLIRWVFRLVDFPLWVASAIIGGVLPWWSTMLLFAGIGSVIASPKSQRIGDLLAGTIVIDTRTTTSWEDTVFTEIETGYQPRYPNVMQLSDKDINTLKSIINTVKKKNDFDLSMRVAERIRYKLHIENNQDSLDFLETLLKDYNYYATK